VTNRTVRSKLSVQRDPHWRLISEGQHLGYHKLGAARGTWIARYYTRNHGRRFMAFGVADDATPANGTHVFSFQQALEVSHKWFSATIRADAAGVHIGPYKVSDAGAAWIAGWKGSEASKRNSEAHLKNHILPSLGSIEVAKLTRQQVQTWLQQLAKKTPLKISAREASQEQLAPSRRSKVVYNSDDPITKRRRQDSANRVFNDLSALLTRAYDDQHVVSKMAWETIKRFDNVSVATNEYLTLEEANSFIEACPQDFRDLVQAALMTGCRYGELSSLRVGSYDMQLRSISIIQSKTGKLKHVFLTDNEANFFDNCLAGKQREDLMFRREDGEPWRKSNQQPRMSAVLKAAGITRHVRFHDLRHTFATLLAMNGTSIQLIANQLGHSGTRVAEKHYAHFSPMCVATTVRANKPAFSFDRRSTEISQNTSS
jgi:integrase